VSGSGWGLLAPSTLHATRPISIDPRVDLRPCPWAAYELSNQNLRCKTGYTMDRKDKTVILVHDGMDHNTIQINVGKGEFVV
jgi:hypothetical protein